MRADMYELLLERPRGGRRIRHTRRRLDPRRLDEAEAAPKRCSISRHGPKTKWLNENLAPLWRFLERRLGQPWDRVHGEIRTHLRCDSAVQLHVLQHLERDVIVHVDLVDGVPHDRSSGRPLWPGWHRFYVCPRTGLLRRYHPGRAQLRAQQAQAQAQADADRDASGALSARPRKRKRRGSRR